MGWCKRGEDGEKRRSKRMVMSGMVFCVLFRLFFHCRNLFRGCPKANQSERKKTYKEGKKEKKKIVEGKDG